MSESPDLHWLPKDDAFRTKRDALAGSDGATWTAAAALAGTRLGFLETNALDATVRRLFPDDAPAVVTTPRVRLAILGSSTTAHLHAGIRVAGLRRNIHVTTYEGGYGQYRQELTDTGSALHRFAPTAVLFALEASEVAADFAITQTAGEAARAVDVAVARIERCWTAAQERFGCSVLQQTLLNVFPALMGGNEHRLPGSKRRAVDLIIAALRIRAEDHGVDLVAIDAKAAEHGLLAWHDAGLWARARQDISPVAAPLYGELVGRLLAARQGLSRKCLVLDLDNTLWGGVIGDDGLGGIVLGPGSALGEGYQALQTYARDLSRRGVVLAVCSKNEEAEALAPFDRHPEMVLGRDDIASFRANWSDKPANLRAIAAELNIGLDALVFLDDSPFERAFVRRELPMVGVPEVADEPLGMIRALDDAGYFESVALTDDDTARTRHYRQNATRRATLDRSSGTEGYLRDLDMVLTWGVFDAVNHQRIVQLINKTNQFNLTTTRHTSEGVTAIAADPSAFGIHLRLADRFGDNGLVAVVIGRLREPGVVALDTWLMSCRVLGRQVEAATLNVVVRLARGLGAARLVGEYRPSGRNAMVSDHYPSLGFTRTGETPAGGSLWSLEIAGFVKRPAPMSIETTS